MKIAICNIQEFNPMIGGIERVSLTLASSLIEQGHELFFVACQCSPYSEKFQPPAKQIFLPEPNDYAVENIEKFSEIIKNEQVDLIINQSSHARRFNKFIAQVKKKTGVKVISVLHLDPNMRISANRNQINWQYLPLKHNLISLVKDICTRGILRWLIMRPQSQMYRELYHMSDKVVLLSENFINSFQKIAKLTETSKLTAIANMLSFQYDRDISYPKKRQLLYCGRLVLQQKRPDRVLYAWRLLQHKLPDWELVIVGDGPFKDNLAKICHKLNLNRVSFKGFQTPEKYYKESPILVLTSNYEGYPLVITEAMQYGCIPVVFNSFGSITDVITHGQTGYLIKPFNIKEYANHLEKLAISAELQQEMSQNSQSSMAKLTPENIYQQWQNLFIEL